MPGKPGHISWRTSSTADLPRAGYTLESRLWKLCHLSHDSPEHPLPWLAFQGLQTCGICIPSSTSSLSMA